MPTLRKLFGLWMIGKSVSSTSVILTRLLVSMAAIAIGIAFASVFVLILTAAFLWLGYMELIAIGFTQQGAILALSCGVLALLGITLYLVHTQLRRMQNMSQHILHSGSPVSRGFSNVADSFMDGLLYESRPYKNKKA